ncbi:MAG: C45 family autoproteolytic acyltransferase/hydrolase [Planctomycetota bacterium]|nr:C45 family autoproteolytic acyltransferase/hydrolase [Planctomycetota bacterium]
MKSKTRAMFFPLALFLTLHSGCALQDYSAHRSSQKPSPAQILAVKIPHSPEADLTNLDSIPLLKLKGNGYDRGYQYGQQYPKRWKEAVQKLEAAAVREIAPALRSKWLAATLYRAYTAHVFNIVDDFSDPKGSLKRMPAEYQAYVQGIADGAGLESSDITRLIATVMLSDASCSGFIAYGPATEDGRLIQLRNLDWGDPHMRPQDATVLLAHEPENGYRYLSIGFVGLIGSVSGINEHGISLTEIGSETADKTRAGMPMPLMLESILARAKNLDEALQIMRESPGSGGYNFLVGSAKERRGAVVEKTANKTAVFLMELDNYKGNDDFQSFQGFDCRADTAADLSVRKSQLCSGGDPSASKPPSPSKSGAYRKRYKPQVELFQKFKTLNIERAAEIADRVAPRSNLHSILYDFEKRRVYVRNKAWYRDGRHPSKKEEKRLKAASQAPAVVDLDLIFPRKKPIEP